MPLVCVISFKCPVLQDVLYLPLQCRLLFPDLHLAVDVVVDFSHAVPVLPERSDRRKVCGLYSCKLLLKRLDEPSFEEVLLAKRERPALPRLFGPGQESLRLVRSLRGLRGPKGIFHLPSRALSFRAVRLVALIQPALVHVLVGLHGLQPLDVVSRYLPPGHLRALAGRGLSESLEPLPLRLNLLKALLRRRRLLLKHAALVQHLLHLRGAVVSVQHGAFDPRDARPGLFELRLRAFACHLLERRDLQLVPQRLANVFAPILLFYVSLCALFSCILDLPPALFRRLLQLLLVLPLLEHRLELLRAVVLIGIYLALNVFDLAGGPLYYGVKRRSAHAGQRLELALLRKSTQHVCIC